MPTREELLAEVGDATRRGCPVTGCERPVSRGGLCSCHGKRLYRYGSVLPNVPIGTHAPRLPCCTVPGCRRTTLAKGLCSVHYQRLRLTGDVQADRPVRAYKVRAYRQSP